MVQCFFLGYPSAGESNQRPSDHGTTCSAELQLAAERLAAKEPDVSWRSSFTSFPPLPSFHTSLSCSFCFLLVLKLFPSLVCPSTSRSSSSTDAVGGRATRPTKRWMRLKRNGLFSQSGPLIISNVLNLILNKVFVCFSGMFTYMKDSRCHWFSSWKCDNYSEFQLVGTVSLINSNKTIRVCRPLTACYVRKVYFYNLHIETRGRIYKES